MELATIDGLVDLVAVDALLPVDLLEARVQGPTQGLAQGAWVAALVGDAAHHVAAAEALRVLEGSAADDAAADQVDEAEDDRGGAHVHGQAQHVLAAQVERDAVVEDRAIADRDDRVDLGDGLPGLLEDVHAPADDGELDVVLDRLDLGLAGQSEGLRQVLLGLGARGEGIAALADLDDTLTAAARASA